MKGANRVLWFIKFRPPKVLLCFYPSTAPHCLPTQGSQQLSMAFKALHNMDPAWCYHSHCPQHSGTHKYSPLPGCVCNAKGSDFLLANNRVSLSDSKEGGPMRARNVCFEWEPCGVECAGGAGQVEAWDLLGNIDRPSARGWHCLNVRESEDLLDKDPMPSLGHGHGLAVQARS